MVGLPFLVEPGIQRLPFFEKCGKRTPGPGPRFNSVGEKKWLWVSHELCPRKGMNHKPVQGSYPANVQIAQVCCMRKRRMQGCLKSRDKFKASDFCDGGFPYFLAFFRAVVPQGHTQDHVPATETGDREWNDETSPEAGRCPKNSLSPTILHG